jgi:simple sugar transport system ATP-binding protein
VLRKGKYTGTVDVAPATKEELSEMMVGRKVSLNVDKPAREPGKTVLDVKGLTVKSRAAGKNAVDNVTFQVREGEIVCIAGIDGNGQSELVYALTGLLQPDGGSAVIDGADITRASIRQRGLAGMAHIPEDRHKHGLVLDYPLAYNLILQRYFEPKFQHSGFLKYNEIYGYAKTLIDRFDIRSGQGAHTITRSMSGGNQQKAIIAREIDRDPKLLIAVQPTRGLDVGAIEYIHSQLIAERGKGTGILLVSLELDEVLSVSDRVLVIYEGQITAELNPQEVSYQEIGLYMSGSKRRAAG